MPWPRTDSAELIDPYGGQRDLAQRLLRHVSEAFVEDPVRVLRVARFAARFAPLGFRIAPETMALMRRMTARRRGERPGARTRLAGNRARAARSRAAGILRDAARLRCPRGALPRSRCALWRTAAATLASGDRHRRARHARAALRSAAPGFLAGALRRTHARSGQGAHAARALAEPPRPRGAVGARRSKRCAHV